MADLIDDEYGDPFSILKFENRESDQDGRRIIFQGRRRTADRRTVASWHFANLLSFIFVKV